MSRRNAVYVAVILVCAALAAWITFVWKPGTVDDHTADILKHGQHIRVICTNPDCKYTQEGYRAHSDDLDWPKACPQCGQETLYRAWECPYCLKQTIWMPWAEDRPSIRCIHCGRDIPLAMRGAPNERREAP